jgi:putative membrane protein
MTLRGWSAAACVAVLSVACNSNSANRSDGYDDSTAITTNESASQTTAGTSGLATDAERFAEDAMMANKAEIRLGELAAGRAQNAQVKQFAQMMVRDHGKALNELKQAVKSAAITEPANLDSKHQELYERLSKLNGAEFDREYMKAMVDGHRDVEEMLSNRAEHARSTTGTSGRAADEAPIDNAVTQWASKTVPVVTQHRQKAEQVYGQLK